MRVTSSAALRRRWLLELLGCIKGPPCCKSKSVHYRSRVRQELAGVMAAAGIAQNLGAMRALATSGIQAGHMKLHARNMAVSAGAVGDEIERVANIVNSQSGQ